MSKRAIDVAASLALAVAAATTAPRAAFAQPEREVHVRFAPGESRVIYRDRIRGYRTIRYIVPARAGQRLTVRLRSSNPSNHFNIMALGDSASMFTGSVSGRAFAGTLSRDGNYRIRVYLIYYAGRRNENARFRLTISLDDGVAAPRRQ